MSAADDAVREACGEQNVRLLRAAGERYKAEPEFRELVELITHIVTGHNKLPADPVDVARGAAAVALDFAEVIAPPPAIQDVEPIELLRELVGHDAFGAICPPRCQCPISKARRLLARRGLL